MLKLKGLPASPGIAIGKAFIYRKYKSLNTVNVSENVEGEISRFQKALEHSKRQIIDLKEKIKEKIGENEAAIFEAHLMILEDHAFIDRVIEYIRDSHLSAEKAVENASNDIIKMFEAMESEYFRSRADDIKDLRDRILKNLKGETSRELRTTKPVIIAATELFPSDTVKMRRQKVLALITEKGGITSHAAIIARAMKIPAVVGVKGLLEKLRDGDLVLVDGSRGIIIVNPSEGELQKCKKKDR